MVPVRCALVLFGNTVYPAEPLPVPVWPNEIVIQGVVVVTVREHEPELAVMATVKFPPGAPTL
jgi:hypothetical protein